MKTFSLFCWIFMSFHLIWMDTAYSQTTSEDVNITLDDLKTPPSPAFVLLGVEPSSIESPTTPKAVSASLFSAFASSDLIPDSYALEFAPYWLKSHPDLKFEDYYDTHSLGETFLRYLSLSVATTKNEISTDSSTFSTTSIGLGFRTRLLEGKVDEKLKKQFEEKEKLVKLKQIHLLLPSLTKSFKADSVAELQKEYHALIDNKLMPPNSILSFKEISDQRIKEYLNKTKNTLDELFDEARLKYGTTDIQEIKTFVESSLAENASEELREVALDIQGLAKKRTELIWEMAGAMSLDFPREEFDQGKVNRFGLWSTLTYRWTEPFIDASLLTRFITEDKTGKDGFLFDMGGKLSYSFSDFSLSAEFVRRSVISGKINQLQPNIYNSTFSIESSSRITGELEYKLRDGLYLKSTFGKDYKRVGFEGDLIAQIGLNFGFGQKVELE